MQKLNKGDLEMDKVTKFYVTKLSELAGGTIESACHTPDGYFGLVVKMPNKSKKNLFILRDDEGNGPGSFEIQEA